MSTILYIVECKVTYATLETDWLEWMTNEHIPQILKCGAQKAVIFLMDKDGIDSPIKTYEIQYHFQNRTSFEAYMEKHASTLRQESLRKFPVSDGFHYKRRSGMCLQSL
jgi:hypothetical protein